jgi:hypothetical protein
MQAPTQHKLKATSDEIKQKNKGMLLQYAKKD